MKGFVNVNRPVALWQVVVLNAITILALVGLVLGASAVGAFSGGRGPESFSVGAQPDAFRPAGTFRMAQNTSVPSIQVTGAMGETTTLSVSFTVAAGKVADIMAFWNAELTHASVTPVGLCFAMMRLDNAATGPILDPGEMLVLDGDLQPAGGALHGEAAGIQARRIGIGPGTHTLYVRAETGGAGCYYGQQSIFVIADVR